MGEACGALQWSWVVCGGEGGRGREPHSAVWQGRARVDRTHEKEH